TGNFKSVELRARARCTITIGIGHIMGRNQMSSLHGVNRQIVYTTRRGWFSKTATRVAASVSIAALVAAVLPGSAQAPTGNGVWNQTSGGTWDISNTSPWLSGQVANGAGFLADFSTQNITSDQTITLDNALTIGALIFKDSGTASNNWILASSPANTPLFLD